MPAENRAGAGPLAQYTGSLRAIVHALKYDGRRSLAVPLAARMREQGQSILDGAQAVVPVPLHPARRRERGFNQAHDLARQLGLPVVHALQRVQADACRKHRWRQRAVTGTFARRFAPRRAARGLAGTIIVLVDDVSTTGATLEACARALGETGLREVRALTAARVVTRQP